MSEDIRSLVSEQATATQLKRAAIKDVGMRTLRQDGLRKVVSGQTSIDEIVRVTQLDVL